MPDTWPVAVARVQWTFMTFCLLCGSCTAMITAWYAHLKLKGSYSPPSLLTASPTHRQ